MNGLNIPKPSTVACAMDYDVLQAGEFAVALLEDVNFHSAAAALSKIVERERRAFAALEKRERAHRAKQAAKASQTATQGLPLFA